MKISSSSENIIDIELVNNDGQIIKTLEQHLREWLVKRNINPDFYIEEEAKEMILEALQDENFELAYIDEENGLVIEYKEEENEPTTIQPQN